MPFVLAEAPTICICPAAIELVPVPMPTAPLPSIINRGLLFVSKSNVFEAVCPDTKALPAVLTPYNTSPLLFPT